MKILLAVLLFALAYNYVLILNENTKLLQSNYKLKSETTQLKIYKMKYMLIAEIEDKRSFKVSTRVIDAIHQASLTTNYSMSFLLAWADVESNFRSRVTSKRNAVGLMQISYNIWKKELDLTKAKLFNPVYNLEKAIHILQSYDKGSLDQALHYYNNGTSGKYKNKKYVPLIHERMLLYETVMQNIGC